MNKKFANAIKKRDTQAFYMIINKEISINESNKSHVSILAALAHFIGAELMPPKKDQSEEEINLKLTEFKRFFDITQLNINQIEIAKKTLLQSAIEYDAEKVLKFLIDSMRVDVNQCNSSGEPALQIALEQKKNHVVRYLMDNGAAVRFLPNIFNPNKFFPLHTLAKRPLPMSEDDISLTYQLIAKGADLSSFNTRGCTALQEAILAGNYEMVEILIETANAINKQFRNKFDLVNIVREGIEPEERFGPLRLAMTANSANQKKIILYLIKNNANLLERTGTRNLLHLLDCLKDFSFSESANLVQTLVQHGVEVNLQDKDGVTPLHVVAESVNLDLMKILLLNGADITIKNKKNETALNLLFKQGIEKTSTKESFFKMTQESVLTQIENIMIASYQKANIPIPVLSEERMLINYLSSYLRDEELKFTFFYLLYNKMISYQSCIDLYLNYLKVNQNKHFFIELEKARQNIISTLPENYSSEQLTNRLIDLYVIAANVTLIVISKRVKIQTNFLEMFKIFVELANIDLVKYLFMNAPGIVEKDAKKLLDLSLSITINDGKFRNELNQFLEKLILEKDSDEYKTAFSLSRSLSHFFFAKNPDEDREAKMATIIAEKIVNSERKMTSIKSFLDKPNIKNKLLLAAKEDEKTDNVEISSGKISL